LTKHETVKLLDYKLTYIWSLCLSDIPEFVVHIMFSLVGGCC